MDFLNQQKNRLYTVTCEAFKQQGVPITKSCQVPEGQTVSASDISSLFQARACHTFGLQESCNTEDAVSSARRQIASLDDGLWQ